MPVVKVSHLLTIRLCPTSVSFLKPVATRWILCTKPWGSGHRWHKRLKGPVAPSPRTETRWENSHVCVWCCLFPRIYFCPKVPLLGSFYFTLPVISDSKASTENSAEKREVLLALIFLPPQYRKCVQKRTILETHYLWCHKEKCCLIRLICQVGLCMSLIDIKASCGRRNKTCFIKNLEIRLQTTVFSGVLSIFMEN